MPRIGYILETNGELALIATTRQGICAGCSEKSTCSSADAPDLGLAEEISARNPIQAEPGETVEFDLPGHGELKVSLLVWIMPLVGIISGAALGAKLHAQLLLDRDLATLLGAALGAAAIFFVMIYLDRKARGDERLVPVIQKVVSPSSCPALPVRNKV